MNPQAFRDAIEPRTPLLERISWLRSELLPTLVRRLGDEQIRRSMALIANEPIPTNERNLTDTRNRVSLIYEFQIAAVSNALLSELGVDDCFWSYVTSNRFPDLEIRDRQGGLKLRVEMKCLQSVAEEKSANFDTLVRDLHPDLDFVVVLLWEWRRDQNNWGWEMAPAIESAFLFHARTLGQIRDKAWLESPPNDCGDGYQGFDLRFAISCKAGAYSEEEGNYGKLLRIGGDLADTQGDSMLFSDTKGELRRLRSECREIGFRHVSESMLRRAVDLSPTEIFAAGVSIGFAAGDVAVVATWKSTAKTRDEALDSLENPVRFKVEVKDKYAWSCYFRGANAPQWSRISSNKKPKAFGAASLNLV